MAKKGSSKQNAPAADGITAADRASKRAVIALGALAQESRLEVFRLLVQCGEQGLAAGEIATQLDIPAATLSFHLKELLHAGLVTQERQGRSLIYQIHVKSIQDLFTYLMQDCCQGRPDLCRPALVPLPSRK